MLKLVLLFLQLNMFKIVSTSQTGHPSHGTSQSHQTKRDFNSMAQILIDSEGAINVTEHPAIEAPEVHDIYNVIADENENQPTAQIQYVSDNVSNELLIVIMQNQEKIMKKLAEISVQLDLDQSRAPFVCPLGQAEGFQNKKFTMEPINTLETLEKFESQLSNPESFRDMLEKYSILCSVAEGSGYNCAYRLLDSLFTKEFLCKCSWTGGSRGSDVKIGFKRYKNIINFFFEMVHSWDCKYTIQKNEDFFKSVLRNALKRKDTKNLRKSTKKTKKISTTNTSISAQEKNFVEEETESLC